MEIAPFAGFAFGQAAVADAELMTVLAAGGHAEFDGSIEGGHADFRSQHRFPRRDVEIVVNVRALGVEIRVGGVAHPQVKIARFATARSRFALSPSVSSPQRFRPPVAARGPAGDSSGKPKRLPPLKHCSKKSLKPVPPKLNS